jgi:O-antigen/teichoic acid export membrane protein
MTALLGPVTAAPARRTWHWGALDQAVSSASNFVPSVLVARAVDPRGFSGFVAVFSASVFLIGLLRGAIGEPLLIRAERVRSGGSGVGSSALSAALVVGVALGVVGVGASFLVTGPVRAPLLAFGLTIPGVLLQDTARYVLFASLRHRAALINDVLWLVLMGFGFVAWEQAGRSITGGTGLLLWGGAGWICALVGVAQARGSLWTDPLRVARENGDLGRHLGFQFLALAGAGQLALYLLGAVSGLVALGQLRSVQLLFGPMNVIFLGAYVSLVPRGLAGDPARLRRDLNRATVILTAMALLSTAVLLAIPPGLGAQVLGDSWAGAHRLVLLYGIYMVTLTLATTPTVGLAVLEQARTMTCVRLGSVPMTIAVPVLAGARWGAGGYLGGLLAVGVVMTIAWWTAFERHLARPTRRPAVPAPVAG